MKIEPQLSDEGLLRLLGERLARVRVTKNLTQMQLAEQAGLGLRTVQRLELGESAAQLASFIRVCRVLGLLDRLEAFLPEPAMSPIAQMKLQGRQRRRVRGEKSAPAEPKKWTWGESL